MSVFKSFPIHNLSKAKEEETVKKLGNKRRGALVTGTEGSIFLTNKKNGSPLYNGGRKKKEKCITYFSPLAINK